MSKTNEVGGDVLIRQGMVVDGTGAPARPADVRVRDGVIVEVAPGLAGDGEPEIDASGGLVTPGFIDNHTHFDPTLFWDSSCDPMPQHGVTTVVMGNCSLSLAPVRRDRVHELTSMFCYIEDLPEAAFDQEIPWVWERYPEYLEEMSTRALSLNAASLVGHSMLRLFVLGDEAWERPANEAEIAEVAALLDECLAAGALGMSTSLGFDEDRAKRPVPSRVADDSELRALFEVLARRHRVLQFIPTPSPRRLADDVRRVAHVSLGLDLVQTWIGAFHDERKPELAISHLDLAAELQAAGSRSYPQVSPRTLDIQVNWQGGMSFLTLAESWHRLVQAPSEDKARMLADPAWRALARDEWDRVSFSMIRHHSPGNIRLVSVTRPELEPWVGRSLAQLAEFRGAHPSDALADWLLDNDLVPGIVGVGIANSDPDGVAEMLCHPAAIIGNSDAGAHLQMMCAVGDSTLLLTRHVRDRGDMTIEAAVQAITARQAALFGIVDRGVIAPGMVADLNVFALDELSWEPDVFVRDLPGDGRRLRRPAGGYRHTLVAGTTTQQAGELSDQRPGRLVRSG